MEDDLFKHFLVARNLGWIAVTFQWGKKTKQNDASYLWGNNDFSPCMGSQQ